MIVRAVASHFLAGGGSMHVGVNLPYNCDDDIGMAVVNAITELADSVGLSVGGNNDVWYSVEVKVKFFPDDHPELQEPKSAAEPVSDSAVLFNKRNVCE